MEDSEGVVSLTSHYLKTDTSALKFTDKYLLAGVGNTLYVYDISTLQLVLKRPTSFRYRIDGIYPYADCSTIVLNNGKWIMVVSSPDSDCRELSCWQIENIVLDIKWFSQFEIIILSNYSVSIWNYNTKQMERERHCWNFFLSSCGLLLVDGDRLDDIVVLSGTHLLKINIWFPFNSRITEMVHILSGHRRIITSIFFNEKLNLISSTSSDRTVRIWKLCPTVDSAWMSKSDRWQQSNIYLKLTISCAISSIWSSMILDNGMVISMAENSQLRIWDSCGNLLEQWKIPQNKAPWCFDADKKLTFLVTGDKGGGISSWPLPTIARGSNLLISYNNRQLIDRVKELIPQQVVLTKQKRLVVVTENGTVLWSDYSSGYRSLNVMFVDDRLSNYCLLTASLQRDFMCLASITGTIIILEEKDSGKNGIIKLFDEPLCNGKIFSVHWLEHNHFIMCVENGELELWKLSCDDISSYSLLKLAQFTLPVCKERWLTSALQYGSYILVADRNASIHLYSLSNPSSVNEYIAPSVTFRKVHNQFGVSAIYCFTDGKICTTGRDGYIRHWIIRDDGQLDYLSADKLAVKRPVHIVNTKTRGLLVLSLDEANLELWSMDEKRPILKCVCDGYRRSLDFIFDDKVYFAYLKEKTICALDISFDHLIKRSVLPEFHAGEINSIICMDNRLLISAGDDRTLRLSQLNYRQHDLNHFAVLRSSDNASFEAISCTRINTSYYLVGINGRARELKMWKIDLKYDALYRINNADRCYQELTSYVLKDEDTGYRSQSLYLDVKIIRHQIYSHKLVIITACSDGILRIFTFNTNTNQIQIEYTHHCSDHSLMKIYTLTIGTRFIVITTATDDGALTFWDATDFINKHAKTTCPNRFELFYRITLYKSTVNSCDSIVHDDTLVLCTGGDDTELRLTIFNVNPNAQPTLVEEDKIPKAHTRITGLKLTDRLIISTGLDQRIKIWQWSLGDYKITKLEMIYQYPSCVFGLNGLTTWTYEGKKQGLCVYGEGIEVFKLLTPFSDKIDERPTEEQNGQNSTRNSRRRRRTNEYRTRKKKNKRK